MQAPGITVAQGSSLYDTVKALAEKVKGLAGELQTRDQALTAAGDQHKADVAQLAKLQADTTAKIDEQGKQLTDALAKLEETGKANDTTVVGVQNETKRALTASGTNQAQGPSRRSSPKPNNPGRQAPQAELADLAARVSPPRRRWRDGHPPSRRPVVRLPGNGTVFIDIGHGDQVSSA